MTPPVVGSGASATIDGSEADQVISDLIPSTTAGIWNVWVPSNAEYIGANSTLSVLFVHDVGLTEPSTPGELPSPGAFELEFEQATNSAKPQTDAPRAKGVHNERVFIAFTFRALRRALHLLRRRRRTLFATVD